jgi:hypothetical protein
VKMMLATLVITVVVATPLFAAVAGSCRKTLLVEFTDAIVSCDLTGIWLDGAGNIVACEYTC